jgi:prevent-host-death family protein
MTTKIVPISDLRRKTAQIVSAIKDDGDIFYVTQHGRPAVVVLDYAAYEALVDPERKEPTAADQDGAHPVSSTSLSYLAALAQDLGVDDLAENHDHYLYGVEA